MPLRKKNHSNSLNHLERKSMLPVPRKRRQTPIGSTQPNPYFCTMCGIKHLYLCDCGCHHGSHPFGQGCKFHKECDRYSQQHQRVSGESQEVFEARILRRSK